ncbi:MAG TPA: protein phosphatase 2C domain-containing protein [Streptosporangiaceae bacterium]|nr:protein phosphatase 2C domain-containing protein [Streptosporangiaceae bacterium]
MHDGNTGVTCPTCGGTAGAADSFCESCGTELAPPVSSAGPPGYTAQCPVCSLDDSAEPGPISAEGYCESCGRKVPSGRDHIELNLELLAGVTDRGLRHPRNEDAMALATTETPAGPVAIAVVCDGVSSSPNPEDASLTGAQAAVRMLLSSIRRGDDPDEASMAAVRQAHEAMAILGSPSRAPSATYVSVIVGPEEVTLCWLGDSRAYWLATESESVRLTRDDSLAEELVAQGQMTEAEAMASPQAHVITRWLGADVAAPEPHVTRFEPPGRGIVLVCSDGLWNYQPEAAGLAQIALPEAFHDPSSAADALLKFALDAGGMDNITIVLIPFPLVRPAPLPRRIRHDRLRLHHRRRPEPVPARGWPRRERGGHRVVRGGRRHRGPGRRRG